MNYSHTYRVPGVYIDPEPKQIQPITISDKCVAGFIGFAEKGPLNRPVRIGSYYEFQKVFGSLTDYAYLAYSVYGFFNSGGNDCIVVRIAHQNEQEPENSAQKAELIFSDVEKKPMFKFEAPFEGTLGNLTQVKLWYDLNEHVLVKKRSANDDWQEWFEVSSVEHYAVGDVVCVEKGLAKEYSTITKITENTIHMANKIPFHCDPAREVVKIHKVLINVLLHNSREKIYEEYHLLSLNRDNSIYFINHINKKSKLVKATNEGTGTIPEEVSFTNLRGGKNGVLGITPGDFIGHYYGLNDASGLGIFEGLEEISLLVAPDVIAFEEFVEHDKEMAFNNILTVQRAMIDQCERLDDNRFAILDCPTIEDFMGLLKWRNKFDSHFAAMYYPKLEMVNPEDMRALTTIYVPPSGHIAGVYAACDKEDGIFRAPANKFINGAVGVARYIEDEEYEITYEKGMNCLQYLPGRGIRIWGARTLSSDINWRFINVRRTFSMIKNAIRRGSGWAVFEPNTTDLRKRVVRHVNAFLLDLWKKGFMAGVEPDDGYYIICDDELNPPEEVDAGRINIEVGIAIARPAEFLVVKLKADGEQGIVSFEE